MLRKILQKDSKFLITIKKQLYYLSQRNNPNSHTFDQTIKTVNKQKPKGVLTIIPTPIGNLKDMTPNMLKKLFQADLIGCQDRRVAGQLYKLIKQRKIVEQVVEKFGYIGASVPKVNVNFSNQKQPLQQNAIMESNISEFGQDRFNFEKKKQKYFGSTYFQTQDQQQKIMILQKFDDMTEKQKKKFISRSFKTIQLEKKFMMEYLKFKSVRIMNQHQQFMYKQQNKDKIKSRNSQYQFDDIYGIQTSDLAPIEYQIKQTRIKKGRGLLIPLNTYNQTKMFDLVRLLLEKRKIAIVTDAGMPCISDPGWKIIDHVRTKMPDVKIQVIGGPSSLAILLFLANIVKPNKINLSNNLSGRFQGFAAAQVSQVTDQHAMYDQKQIKSKKQDFSIHYINSKKLKKHALGLQKIYGQNHRIIVVSQLTKLYERKFHGTIKQLNEYLSKDQNNFQTSGQMSYLLYPQSKSLQKEQQNHQKQKENNQQKKLQNIYNFIQKNPKISVNINQFIQDLEIKNEEGQSVISSKQKIEVLKAVFGIKDNQAKKKIYQKLKPIKNNQQFKKAYELYPSKSKLQ